MTTLLEHEDPVDHVAYVREKFKIDANTPIDPSLAKSKYEADEFIKMKNAQFDTLSADYLRLKADYEARAKLEELVDKIQPQDKPLVPDAKPALKEEIDYDKIIESKLAKREAQQRADANIKVVKDTLREKLGSKMSSYLKDKMDELDLTTEELDSLAARSPKAFMRTLGLEEAPRKDPFQSPPPSIYKSDNFKPKTEKRDWEYYQKLKETNPRAWLDPKVQTQMYHDAQELGAEFGTGDFNRFNERLT